MSLRFASICLILLALVVGCTGPQMLNSMTPTKGYHVATNLVYDEVTNLRLDVYSPADAKNAPVVIFFHGGRWMRGAKEDFRFVGESMASRGFVGVIADFRQYPQVRFPAFVDDAAKAVAWVHNNISTYGADPEKLFVMGHSSGGQIAALLVVKDDYMKKAGGSRAWIRGMIGLAGAYDFLPITEPDLRDVFAPPEKFTDSQPIMFANGDNPPMLLLHGEDDEVVSVKATRSFATQVAKAGGPVDTVIYPEMKHQRMVASLAKPFRGQSDVIDNVEQFVNKWSPHAYVPPNKVDEAIQAVPVQIEE